MIDPDRMGQEFSRNPDDRRAHEEQNQGPDREVKSLLHIGEGKKPGLGSQRHRQDRTTDQNDQRHPDVFHEPAQESHECVGLALDLVKTQGLADPGVDVSRSLTVADVQPCR